MERGGSGFLVSVFERCHARYATLFQIDETSRTSLVGGILWRPLIDGSIAIFGEDGRGFTAASPTTNEWRKMETKIAKVSSQSEASEAVTSPDAFCFPSAAYKVHRPVVSHSLQVYALDSK